MSRANSRCYVYGVTGDVAPGLDVVGLEGQPVRRERVADDCQDWALTHVPMVNVNSKIGYDH